MINHNLTRAWTSSSDLTDRQKANRLKKAMKGNPDKVIRVSTIEQAMELLGNNLFACRGMSVMSYNGCYGYTHKGQKILLVKS